MAVILTLVKKKNAFLILWCHNIKMAFNFAGKAIFFPRERDFHELRDKMYNFKSVRKKIEAHFPQKLKVIPFVSFS